MTQPPSPSAAARLAEIRERLAERPNPIKLNILSAYEVKFLLELLDEAAERAKPAASDLAELMAEARMRVRRHPGTDHTATIVGRLVDAIAAALAERGRVEREAERARCVEILHEEGWLGRSEQRIAHPEDNQTTNDEA